MNSTLQRRARCSTILALLATLTACLHTKPVTPSMASVPTEVMQKLDPALRNVAEAARSKAPSHIALEDGLVRVKIVADKAENVPALEKLVAAAGGQVVTKLDVALFALLPPSQVEAVARDPRVWNITAPQNIASPAQL